jgi:hypothetical protein
MNKQNNASIPNVKRNSDGLTDYRIKESTNLNILEAVKAIQVTNNTSLARGQDKMLDNTVKIDKIETD